MLAAGGLSSPDPTPDVLLLVMDTTRADRCSVLGYARPTTPRLSALAEESTTFARAWSPSPWTMPAHAALFSGLRPDTVGMLDTEPQGLPAGTPTLAEILARRGYATGCFTNNPWIGAHSGLSRGFSLFRAIHEEPGGGSARSAHDEALAWMQAQRRDGRRFFAFVNDLEPHAPWNPPSDVRAQFVHPGTPDSAVELGSTLEFPRTIGAGLGRLGLDDAVRRAASDLYDGEVASLDSEVGRLLDGMRAAGLLDGTLVVVTSDHGEGLADHGWWEHGIDLHREVLHVPLVIRRPGGGAAERVDELVRLEDLFPTILEACGAPVPEAIDGLPLLSGDLTGRVAVAGDRTRSAWLDELDALYGEGASAPLDRRTSSVFDGRFHLLVDDRGEVLLYDTVKDPAERNDVHTWRPEVVERLRRHLDPR